MTKIRGAVESLRATGNFAMVLEAIPYARFLGITAEVGAGRCGRDDALLGPPGGQLHRAAVARRNTWRAHGIRRDPEAYCGTAKPSRYPRRSTLPWSISAAPPPLTCSRRRNSPGTAGASPTFGSLRGKVIPTSLSRWLPRTFSSCQIDATVPKRPIHGLTNTEVVECARRELDRGHGFGRRIHRMAVCDGLFEPEALGLGREASEAWREHFSFELPKVVRIVTDEGEQGATSKVILRLSDGLEVESVRIPMGRGRFTLCVSSQVGCKMGCTFCETGRMGLLRHLTVDEIVGQLLVARHVLDWRIRNVVFMGMGEALDNADNLIRSLRILNDPAGLAIAQERITVLHRRPCPRTRSSTPGRDASAQSLDQPQRCDGHAAQ